MKPRPEVARSAAGVARSPMDVFLTIGHVIVCVFLILIVLLQAGKGAGIGVAFGGASSTLFGSRNAGNFLSRLAGATAAIFMITSVTLAWRSSSGESTGLG